MTRARFPARRRRRWEALYATRLYQWTLIGAAPSRTRGRPPDPWAGDPARGSAIIAGSLPAGDGALPVGATGWPADPAGEAAAAAVHGFAWLRDLRAVSSGRARQVAGDLTARWMAAHAGWSPVAWRIDVLGERLFNWLVGLPFVCGDDEALQAALLASLARQARHLARAVPRAEDNSQRFAAHKGLVAACLCLPGHEGGLATTLGRLERDIGRQILPDGGHAERSPSVQLAVLTALIDIRGTLLAAKAEVPDFVQGAIDRMVPLLRSLRHGDGGLALFNDSVEEDRGRVDAVIAHSEVKGKALSSAPHSGFQRLAAGRTVVVQDTGAPAAGGTALHAHAGTLSFEMSAGRERLVVNCGAYPDGGHQWREALRATAAHSTVTVNDTNSYEIGPADGRRRAAMDVTCSRRERDGAVWVHARHDGYGRSAGVIHDRVLYLSAAGDDLRGRDGLTGRGDAAFAVRFHLHPQVQVSLNEARTAVLLNPPSGRGWRMQADGGRLDVAESVYFGGGERRRTSQIVVSGRLAGGAATVRWRFGRVT